MFRRCAKCFAPFISVNSPYETAASVANSQWEFVPILQSRKLRLREVVTCLRALSNIQSILYSINYFPCLASETPPSVGSKSPPWLLLPSIMFDCFFAFFSPLVLMSLQSSPSHQHRRPRSSHLIMTVNAINAWMGVFILPTS